MRKDYKSIFSIYTLFNCTANTALNRFTEYLQWPKVFQDEFALTDNRIATDTFGQVLKSTAERV